VLDGGSDRDLAHARLRCQGDAIEVHRRQHRLVPVVALQNAEPIGYAVPPLGDRIGDRDDVDPGNAAPPVDVSDRSCAAANDANAILLHALFLPMKSTVLVYRVHYR